MVLVVVAALFIDGYSLFYRYVVVHQPLGTTLTSNPNIGGRALYLRKGLDLQGGTELVIAVCKGPNNPPGDQLPLGSAERQVGERCAAGDAAHPDAARQLPRCV